MNASFSIRRVITLYFMISSNALCNKLQFQSEFLCLSRNLVLVVVQLFNDALLQQVQPRT